MRDKREMDSAESFCSMGVEAGLIEKGDVEPCMQAYRQSDRYEFRNIADLFLSRGLLKASEIKAIHTALKRLERDANKDDIYIPGYKIISKIGDGGLGTVYKAKQITMNRIVALKVLHPKWLSDREFYNRFILEARITGKMSHQNLLQIYDVSQVDNLLYFSMEFVDGETVEHYIENNGLMPVGVATNIVRQVARALNYIKEFDVVHRDVKPGNILLTKTGVAKLGDFGFLKSIYDPEISGSGEILGTPDYIAPEQAAGEDVDFRADIYSLGVSYYHMIAGEVPFKGSVSSVIKQHMKSNVPPLTKVAGKELPDELSRVIHKMIARDRNKRHQSFKDLFNDLESIRFKETSASGHLDMTRTSIINAFKGESSRNVELKNENEKLKFKLKIMTLAVLIGIIIITVGVIYILLTT